MTTQSELIIIGAGPAGLTAAIYAARANLKPIVLTGSNVGGQLITTSEVENFPGFPDGVNGPVLMQNMIKQAQKFGAELVYKNVTKVNLEGKEKMILCGNDEYSAKAVIIATGSSSRKLGIESEMKFWGRGVSSCATCDGALYRGKTVAVIGGGDSAMEEANFLTKFASKVYLVHRRDIFKASIAMQEKVKHNDRIEIIYNTEVKEILGGDRVSGIFVYNNITKETTTISVDGVFLAIGHIPNVDFLDGQINLTENGFINPINRTNTNIEGVFVAGDVSDFRYQQAITAAGMGCMAFLDTEKWLLHADL